MSTKQFTVTLGLTALLLGAGCDKGQSTSTPPQTTTATRVPPPRSRRTTACRAPITPCPTSKASVNRRHQQLTLNTDLTAQLDTDITIPGSSAPTSKETATGTYIAKADDVTVTLDVKTASPSPPATQHM